MLVTLYIADKLTNAFLKAADLCEIGKVYVTPMAQEYTRRGTGSTLDFLQGIISLPMPDDRYWIPAVAGDGEIVVADGITQLSDGRKIMFIPAESDKNKGRK